MRSAESGVFPLHYNEDALCSDEVCHDTGWEDRNEDRSIKMDYRRSGKKRSAAYEASVHGNYGWHWNRACR